jgi:hypothetical protein
MASIFDPELSIQVDRGAKLATIAVRCDLGFTDSEIDTMNLFGRRYALDCRLLNAEAPHPRTIIRFDQQLFPRFRDGATRYEHPVFEVVAAAQELHRDALGTDALVAELALSNEDLGTLDVKRTQIVGVGVPT